MKSNEVYQVLRTHMAPVLKDAGFKRAINMLSWTRPHGDHHLAVWCQVSRYRDDYAGSKFTVEFHLWEKAAAGFSVRRERFPALLDGKGREQIRTIQNWVIASLPRPPAGHPYLQAGETAGAFYLKCFQKIEQPYSEDQDIWLRYAREEHLVAWARLIRSHLPCCLEQVEAWDANPAEQLA